MKPFLAYVISLAIILGGGAFAAYTVVTPNMVVADTELKPVPAPAILAKSDASEEPTVDPNDPDLFDARGKFPAAMREAMARAKRESTKDFAAFRAEQIRAAKTRNATAPAVVQRRTRKPNPVPRDVEAAYAEMPAGPAHQRRYETWNAGGFGFGF